MSITGCTKVNKNLGINCAHLDKENILGSNNILSSFYKECIQERHEYTYSQT